jgi:hypothetical protein
LVSESDSQVSSALHNYVPLVHIFRAFGAGDLPKDASEVDVSLLKEL